MNERLKEIEQRCEKATSGPWARKQGQRTRVVSLADEDGTVVASTHTSSFAPPKLQAMANADFIANAREDVPWLVSRVRELEAAVESGERAAFEAGARAADPNLNQMDYAFDEWKARTG